MSYKDKKWIRALRSLKMTVNVATRVLPNAPEMTKGQHLQITAKKFHSPQHMLHIIRQSCT